MRIIFNSSNKNSSNYTFQCVSFQHGGKPITLDYVVQKHHKIIPERVLKSAKEFLATSAKGVYPSLYEIHKKIYEPLLKCKTLDEAKAIFPEFSLIKNEVVFSRKTRYAREFAERTDGNFVLKMLQRVWAEMKSQSEIAEELGMTSSSSLAWPLKQIGFVSYSPNYKTLLKASDEEGNKVIAAKTTAWNAAHPDLMYKKNKYAAQFCKTDEYKQKLSETMKAYYMEHPENIEQKSRISKEMWERVPEIRKAMSDFIKNEPIEIRRLFSKKIKGYPLRSEEYLIIKSVYERFWQKYPMFKEKLSEAALVASSVIKN